MAIAAVAATGAIALALTGCSGASSGGSSGGTVNLSVQTFGQFGYNDLFKKYEQLHPNVKISATTVATSDDAQNSINTHLAAGNGMPDVVAIEGGFLAAEMQYPTKWLPVSDSLKSRWLDWKIKPATDKDGKLRFYGVDAGPAAICYRSDLVAAAGFPSDPDGFAKAIGNTWDSYYAAGKQYAQKTGKAWFDSAESSLDGILAQTQNAFEKNNGKVIATTNPQVKDAYTKSLQDYQTISAKLSPYTPDWNTGVANGAFATAICPSWEIGLIQAGGPNVKGWNVADTFPGGGANRGGSYLGVSTQTKNPKEAQDLAAWLTAPDQEIAAFKAVGSFPSQVDALDSPTLQQATSAYMSNAPTGKIFASRAKAITAAPFKGPQYSKINAYLHDAVKRVEDGSMSESASWDKFVSDVNANTK